MSQKQPENGEQSLSQALDQLLCNLAVEKARLLRELSDPRLHPHSDLVLEPVSADTHTQGGDFYLTVRYKGRIQTDSQHFPT